MKPVIPRTSAHVRRVGAGLSAECILEHEEQSQSEQAIRDHGTPIRYGIVFANVRASPDSGARIHAARCEGSQDVHRQQNARKFEYARHGGQMYAHPTRGSAKCAGPNRQFVELFTVDGVARVLRTCDST